ncbi:hypothetical protein QIS99_26160 [Streptomyces sp. B-S-A8]|uniref:Molecular chaperone DnaJ n=1 Tax=Streptomyces solicavernae TaxID=3043614 RepID=A0ABT6RYX3_9ACTN|nr:hypothetical protein [Streptomyces sp. B-S-A8]MDI3389645.1 hypothetical protein [Streptomyces sp. B-S-A8]
MTLTSLAIACLLIVTICYWILCAVSPFGDCRKCRGLGVKTRITRSGKVKAGKTCRRCHGEGKRIRVGWWLSNRASRIHREGTR